MKTILCFGDSNTRGSSPAGGRYDRDTRWPGALQRELGGEYQVIEEGLGGRTTVWDDPVEGDRNGSRHLPMLLKSHAPLDLVIILLGTNDLKHRFGLSAWDIASGARALAETVQAFRSKDRPAPPRVLLVAPPPLARLNSRLAPMFEGGVEKSRELGGHYRQAAGDCGCAFLDAAEVIVSSDADGAHWDAAEHVKLGRAVARKVKEILE